MITILLLVIIYCSFISLGLPDSLLGSAWPLLQPSLVVPVHFAGYISMIITAGSVFSSIMSPHILRRAGTGLVTALSTALTAFALLSFSFSNSFAALCLCAVPLGLGAGAVDVALNNYVALHFKAKHMNWLHCCWGIGASTGPLIMARSISLNNAWHEAYRIVGIIQLTLALCIIVSLPLWKRRAAVQSVNIDEDSAAPNYKKIFAIPGVAQMLCVFICYCCIEMITGLWGASYLVKARGVEAHTAAGWISLYYGGITFGRFIAGFVTQKCGNRNMVRIGQAVIALGIVLVIIPSNNVLLAGLFLIGLGCAPVFPSLMHETPRNFGREYSSVIMGLQMASAYIGTSLLSILFGKIAAQTTFDILPFCIGFVLIIKLILCEWTNHLVDKTSSRLSASLEKKSLV